MHHADNEQQRTADGEPLEDRGTADRPTSGDGEDADPGRLDDEPDDADEEPPVDESDDGPAPTIRAEDAKYA